MGHQKKKRIDDSIPRTYFPDIRSDDAPTFSSLKTAPLREYQVGPRPLSTINFIYRQPIRRCLYFSPPSFPYRFRSSPHPVSSVCFLFCPCPISLIARCVLQEPRRDASALSISPRRCASSPRAVVIEPLLCRRRPNCVSSRPR